MWNRYHAGESTNIYAHEMTPTLRLVVTPPPHKFHHFLLGLVAGRQQPRRGASNSYHVLGVGSILVGVPFRRLG